MLVCKPRPELLHLGRRIEDVAPVVVDIDDPELLDPWGDTTMLVRAKRVARNGRTPYRFGWARRTVRSMHVITSNPPLQELYGGHLVPHVRVAAAAPEPPGARRRRVPDRLRRHACASTRAITELRAATAELARRRDVRLSITAPAPPDAFPWEDWVGHTSLDGGRELLGACDAVAIVSRPGVWGDRQLPVKLIDAMAAGVPTVVTPRPPLLWATGGAALVVRDGSAADMAEALALLADDTRLASTHRHRGVAAGVRRLHPRGGRADAPRGRGATRRPATRTRRLTGGDQAAVGAPGPPGAAHSVNRSGAGSPVIPAHTICSRSASTSAYSGSSLWSTVSPGSRSRSKSIFDQLGQWQTSFVGPRRTPGQPAL